MTKNLLLFLLTGLLSLAIAELALRVSGRVPGQFEYNRWFHEVDSLYMLQGFVVDQNGIFKADTSTISEIIATVSENENWTGRLVNSYSPPKWVTEAVTIHEDYVKLLDGSSDKGELGIRLNEAIQSDSPSCFDSILINYAHSPINQDGFYSIPFKARCGGKKKVLLLGDSFTWGHAAESITNSFSNILLARGYLVYNTGISGADVAQYQQIVKTYMDSIGPDLVILNFYMGNDVSYFERKPMAGIPIHYSTNAGNLISFQTGEQFNTMEQAYDNVTRNMVIQETSSTNRLAAKTVISTLIWRVMLRRKLVDYHYPEEPDLSEAPFSDTEIKWIRHFCEQREVPFMLSVIPNLYGGTFKDAASVNHLFDGIEFEEPVMTINQYNKDNGHFNREGHFVYANYLEKLILDKIRFEN